MLRHASKPLAVVEPRGELVLPSGDVFAEDPPVAALQAKLDRLVEEAGLDLASDDGTARQKRIDPGILQVDDGETDGPFLPEAVPVIEQDDRMLRTLDKAGEVGHEIATRRKIELVCLLRHLRGTDQPVHRVDMNLAFDAEFSEITVQVDAPGQSPARFSGPVLIGFGFICTRTH